MSLAAAVLIGAAGVAVDYAGLSRQHTEMQDVADTVALASIRALGLQDGKKLNAANQSSAENSGLVFLEGSGISFQEKEVVIDPDKKTATVTISSDGQL